MPSRREVLATAAGTGLLAGAGRARASDRSTTTPTAPARTTDADWPSYRGGPANAGARAWVRGPTDSPDVAWERPLGSVSAAPAVVPGAVVVPGERVRLLDADGGAEVWGVQPGRAPVQQPVVADGTVFLGHADGVGALDLGSGDRRWSAPLEGATGTVAVADGTVYADAEDGSLHALSAGDGSERWRLEGGDGLAVPPTVAGGAVYLGGESVRAVDAETGAERWRAPTPGNATELGPLATAGGRVYGVGTVDPDEAVVAAYDAATGDQLWTTFVQKRANASVGAPVVADGEVLVALESLRGLDPATGEGNWTSAVKATDGATPAVAGGVGYVRSGGSQLRAVDLGDGSPLWSVGFDSALSTAPVVGEGTVYVADDGGTLYAVRDGEGAGRTPAREPRTFGYDWVDTWAPAAGVAGAAHVVGPLVLAGLVGLLNRLSDDDE